MIIRSVLALTIFASVAVLPQACGAAVSQPIANAVADSSRPKDNRNLDAVRKPADVLAFVGVKPGLVVAEYLPGGGYYTRLLSDVVTPVAISDMVFTEHGATSIAATGKEPDAMAAPISPGR